MIAKLALFVDALLPYCYQQQNADMWAPEDLIASRENISWRWPTTDHPGTQALSIWRAFAATSATVPFIQ